MNKIKTLDGLRGYAALFVLIAHLPFKEKLMPNFIITFLQKFQLGYFGVEIFFVLSGFLITRILLKEKKSGKFSFKSFYWKRLLRIFPIYYISILIYLLIDNLENIIYLVTYTSNYFFAFNFSSSPFRHTWSLSVEEQYYLIWPLLIYFFTLKSSKKIIMYLTPIIVLVSTYIIIKNFDFNTSNGLIYRGLQTKILSLSAGSYFAFIEDKVKEVHFKIVCLLITIILVDLTFILNIKDLGFPNKIPVAFILLLMYSLLASCVFILVLNLEYYQIKITRIFTNKIICFLGLISYGLYLYHLPILYYFELSHMHYEKEFNLIQLLIVMLLIFVFPILSYYIIEKPLLKYKKLIK